MKGCFRLSQPSPSRLVIEVAVVLSCIRCDLHVVKWWFATIGRHEWWDYFIAVEAVGTNNMVQFLQVSAETTEGFQRSHSIVRSKHWLRIIIIIKLVLRSTSFLFSCFITSVCDAARYGIIDETVLADNACFGIAQLRGGVDVDVEG